MGNQSFREEDEKSIEISFHLSDMWGEFQTKLLEKVDTLTSTIDKRFENIEKSIDDRFKNIEDDIKKKSDDIVLSLKSINELRENFDNELINLNNINKVIDSFKSTEVVNIYNPTLENILGILEESLSKEVKEGQATLNEKLIKSFDSNIAQISKFAYEETVKSLYSVSKSINNELDNTLSVFKEFELSMKKGKSSILESETIVAKLLYSMRFLEKLSPKAKESILELNEIDIKKVEDFFGAGIKKTITKEETKDSIETKEETKDSIETKEEPQEEPQEEENMQKTFLGWFSK